MTKQNDGCLVLRLYFYQMNFQIGMLELNTLSIHLWLRCPIEEILTNFNLHFQEPQSQ